MKDLITAMASLMILMVFVLQFCMNFILSSRFLAADVIIDNYKDDWQNCQNALASCFECQTNEITKENDGKTEIIRVPLKNIVVCADFLGISEAENKGVYARRIDSHEEYDNSHRNGDFIDHD